MKSQNKIKLKNFKGKNNSNKKFKDKIRQEKKNQNLNACLNNVVGDIEEIYK